MTMAEPPIGRACVCERRWMMDRPLIMVLNADREFLALMQELLSEEGYAVEIVLEGQGAFEAILTKMPHLVIIELLVTDPEAGLMVLNKMRLHPMTTRIPVILASTVTRLLRENEAHFRSKGCDFLHKPFELEELLTMVGKYVPPPGGASLEKTR
jgi:CheY-like chemotaxis protein